MFLLLNVVHLVQLPVMRKVIKWWEIALTVSYIQFLSKGGGEERLKISYIYK